MSQTLRDKVIVITEPIPELTAIIVDSLLFEGATPFFLDKGGGWGLSVPATFMPTPNPKEMMAQIYKAFGRIDGIINNLGPGMGLTGATTNYSDERWVKLTKAAVPFLKMAKGSIVNISFGPIGTKKDWDDDNLEIPITFEWANELSSLGVRVNQIIIDKLGKTSTGIRKMEGPGISLLKKLLNVIRPPIVTPEDVAKLVVFLLSEKSQGLTGEFILLNNRHKILIEVPGGN